MYKSAFSGDAVIVDGMAPYRWSGAYKRRLLTNCQKHKPGSRSSLVELTSGFCPVQYSHGYV